jgi:hypothetical protein
MWVCRNFNQKQILARNKEPGTFAVFFQGIIHFHKNLTVYMSNMIEVKEMIHNINIEINDLKEKLNRLESAVGTLKKQDKLAMQSTNPLPVNELKQLAEMAKRFR